MPFSPCYFSPLSEIPGSIELLENSLTYEGVQWRKITECFFDLEFSKSSCSRALALACGALVLFLPPFLFGSSLKGKNLLP